MVDLSEIFLRQREIEKERELQAARRILEKMELKAEKLKADKQSLSEQVPYECEQL